MAEVALSLFSKTCDFIAGSTAVENLPQPTLPEVAFAGRSNVGKSSLLNALVNRRDLARTSQRPGRTQQLNFFQLHDGLILVDLPGYGYAEAGKKKAKAWTQLTELYLKGRAELKRVYLLIDSRRGLKESDQAFMKAMDEAAVTYHVVLTKCDLVKPDELREVSEKTELAIKKHPAAFPTVLKTSSVAKEGLDDLRQAIIDLITPASTSAEG
jgi:GTP-binding protein